MLHFIDFHLDILKVFDDACVGGSLAPIFCLLVTSTTRPLGLASLCDAHPPTLKTMRKKNFARQTSSPFLDPYLVAVRPLKLSNKKIERTWKLDIFLRLSVELKPIVCVINAVKKKPSLTSKNAWLFSIFGKEKI